MTRSMFLSVAVLLFAGGSQAQEMAPWDRMKSLLTVGRPTSMSYEDAVAELSRVVRIYDRNGDGVTDAELDAAELVEAALQRTQVVQSFLPADLDNDLRITREELETVARAGRGGVATRDFHKTDLDGDGVLTWSEITTIPDRGERTSHKMRLRETSLDIDPTPESPFTLADATTLAEELFMTADRNGDRLIDMDERRAMKEEASIASRITQPTLVPTARSGRSCEAPRPQAGDEVAMLGTYEGGAYASSYLGAPDEPTYVVDVKVEAGDRPLFIMAGAYESVIWRFTGATGRVRQVVLSGHEPQAALGVARSMVAYVARGECFPEAYKFEGFDGAAAKAGIAAFAGRADVKHAGSYRLHAVAVPSMALAPEPRGARFDTPVIDVDAGAVVSAGKVEAYAVLPGRAGLALLVANGSLEQIEEDGFRIVKPIPHFPADLAGAKSVRFLVGKGIPLPEGSAGHSCIVMEQAVGQMARCRP